jgi:sRNA-binding carbon storage regulator CsrA
VLDIEGDNVKLGFEVDVDVPVHRWKTRKRIRTSDGRQSAADVSAAPVL